jgi:hypothetical protein
MDTPIDTENLLILGEYFRKYKKVIIAWGNPPKGLYKEYLELIWQVMKLLKEHNNQLYYVDKMSLAGYPKHGQVWGYADDLKKYNWDSPNNMVKP